MSVAAEFIRNRNGEGGTGAHLNPFLYFGNPNGGQTNPNQEFNPFDTEYDPIDSKTLKHLKISVAAANDETQILKIDTLDCYNGVNTTESPPNNYQFNLTGEAGDFPSESDPAGPAKGLPLSLQKIHFFGFKKDGCCENPSEYYAYTLISNPVKVDSAGCKPSDSGPTNDREAQEQGTVESWNDLSYIFDQEQPQSSHYKERLVIGHVNNSESIESIDFSKLEEQPSCSSIGYQSNISATVFCTETGASGTADECSVPKKMTTLDFSRFAYQMLFLSLYNAYSNTSSETGVQILSDISLSGNQIVWNGYKLVCATAAGESPVIEVTHVSGTLETTTCSGEG